MSLNFNWVDYAILIVFFLSLLSGLMRGFVKELIGLITWVAAFVIATLFASRLAGAFTGSSAGQTIVSSSGEMSHPVSLLSLGISFVCIFVVVLLLGKLINYIVSNAVEGYGISFTNRFLGGLFGLARGFLIVILLMFLVGLTTFSNENWWTQSVFVNYFRPIVQSVENAVQPDLATLKSKFERTLQEASNRYIQEVSDVNGSFTQ